MLNETELCQRFQLWSEKVTETMVPNIAGENPRNYTSIHPRLDMVTVEQLIENVFVVKEDPGLKESWDPAEGKRNVWMVSSRDDKWADKFSLEGLPEETCRCWLLWMLMSQKCHRSVAVLSNIPK